MNLTWHIIKKDLRHHALLLVLWAISGVGALAGMHYSILRMSPTHDPKEIILGFLTGIAPLIWNLLTVTLIGMIVQDDDVTEDKVFWRTRPIKPGRLLAAKMSIILPIFCVLPYVAIWINAGIENNVHTHIRLSFPFTLAPVLCIAGVAACTRTLARFFVGLFLCVIAGAILALTLSILSTFIPRFTQLRLGIDSFTLVSIFCTVLAICVLLNQYFKRRRMLSIGLITLAILGTILIVFTVSPLPMN